MAPVMMPYVASLAGPDAKTNKACPINANAAIWDASGSHARMVSTVLAKRLFADLLPFPPASLLRIGDV